MQFALQVLRAKALGLMGSSKIMFMTDCKLNKIPLPLKKGFAEVCKVCLLEMPPHVVLAPSWQGPSPCPCAMALGRQTSSSSHQHTRVPTRRGKHQDGVESAAPVPGTDIKGRYVASFATRGSCRTAPLTSAGGSSCTGPEAIMEQPAQEGARAKILFLTCFLFI